MSTLAVSESSWRISSSSTAVKLSVADSLYSTLSEDASDDVHSNAALSCPI